MEMAKPRRVFRVFNWSDFPPQVRPGMAVQLRNKVPIVVLKRSKEACEALRKSRNKTSKPQSIASKQPAKPTQEKAKNCASEKNENNHSSMGPAGFTCKHWELEDLMFDFLATVERNGGVQIIENLSGFKEQRDVSGGLGKVTESNNNARSTVEESASSPNEFESPNDNIPGTSDIENVHGDVEFVDVTASPFSKRTLTAMEEPVASPVLKGSKVKEQKPAKRRRTSSAASRKTSDIAQAKRTAAINRIYAQISQRDTRAFSPPVSNPSPTQDPSSGCPVDQTVTSPAVDVEKRKHRRFLRTCSSKHDDFESEGSEEESDDDSLEPVKI